MNGVDAFIDNVTFNDVHMTFPGGGTAEEAAVRDVPKVVGEYYETGVLPSYALFARNVRGLALSNVRFDLAKPDARPAVVFDHVSDAALNGLNVQASPEAESALRLIDTRDVLMSASRLLTPAAAFVQAEGTGCEQIVVDGGDISKARTPALFKSGAAQNAVTIRMG